MTSTITIHIPDAMVPFEGQLRFFFDTMVMKLNINRNKGFAVDRDFSTLMQWLTTEMRELAESLKKESQFEAAVEAADVANFAFLIASRCLMLDKATWGMEQGAKNVDS